MDEWKKKERKKRTARRGTRNNSKKDFQCNLHIQDGFDRAPRATRHRLTPLSMEGKGLNYSCLDPWSNRRSSWSDD